MVGANVLGDATRFTRGHFGAANVIEQRSLAMVHVAHDRDHRGAGHRFGGMRRSFLFREGLRIVQSGHDGFVTHFFHHDHGSVLVQRLVDGDHLPQLHQVLDDLGSLDRHLVRQFGHGDGFGHVHFDDPVLDRLCGLRCLFTVTLTSPLGATAPTVAAHTGTGIATRLDFFFLGIVIGPARRQLGALDFLAIFAGGGGRRTGRPWRRPSRCGGLVQRALDGLGFHRLGGLFGLLGHQNTLGRTHHGANGFCFGQGLAPAVFQIFGAHSVFFGRSFGRGGFALLFGFGRCQGGVYRRLCSFSRCIGRRRRGQ